MSNPFYNVFVAGQSSSIQGEQLLVDEQPQRDLSTGLPHLHSEPSLCFSGTTSLKSVGLATSMTHGSENNAARLEGTTTASIFSCTSDGFNSSSAEFLATSDGKRHSDVDCDKSLFNLSSNPTSDASSKSIADLNVGGTNIVDQSDLPDLNDLAITRQAAAKILINYGLEKEDLDELILCPAEQTTAQNLPRTLWKIRMKKAMRAATENKSPLYSEAPFPSRDYGLDAVSAPEGDGTGQAPVPPNTGQSREVIDSGHLEKYTAVVDKNMDITDSAVKSGDVLHNEKFSKQPPQEGRTLVKSSVLNLLVTNVGLKRNSETPLGSGSVKLLQNEPNSSLTKSKSEVSKSSLLEKLDPTVEPGYGSFTEIIPKPDWISMKGNAISFANSQMEIQDEVPKFTVKSMEQPPQHLLQSHIVQTVVSQVVPAYKPVSFPYFNFPARNDSPFPQSVTRPCSSVHLSPQQVLDPAKTNEKPSLEKSTAKSPPSVTMMHDFAGFTPSKFPHTCSLCKKTCSQMKEWISHKNTSLHLKNCKDLREHSSSPQDDWTFTSRNHSCSKSLERDCSPRRSEKSRLSPRRSIERHPSPRRSIERHPSPRRSIERRPSPMRSRDRCLSPMRSRERRLSPRRSRERRLSPRRSRERRPSPRRSRERRPSPRRSRERRPSPRRSRERRPSPRRSRERRSSPRRSRERRLSPRRSRERRLSPRRSKERRPSPRRSRERRPLPRRIIVRRSSSRSSSERESLPRRGIERRSSSRSSIERWFSPKRSKERRSSSRSSREQESLPRRSRERRSSSRINEEKRLSPRLSHERSTSPKRIEEGYLLESSRSSQQKKDGKPSSLTKICKRKASLPEPSSSQKKPCSLENLTERLLKAPVVQSLSGQPNVEDMVKTVIPVVLEELARMSSSSSLSSPTSLSKLIKDSSGESMISLAGSTSSPSSAVKVEKSTKMGSSPLQNKNSSSVKSKYSKPSPPTMVKLKGTFDTLCHSDLISAMDIFGKTKSVLLFKSKQEARVCFEKEEAALKLKASQNFEIKGVTVTVVPEKDVVFDKPTQTSTLEQTNPQLNSLDRSVNTSQMTSTVLSFKKLLSLPEKSQPISTGKPTTKATSTIVKENTGPTKKTVKCIKTKSIINKAPIDSAVVKTEPSMEQEERSETEDSKQEMPESAEENVLSHKKTPQTEKPADVIVTKLSKEVLASKAEIASATEQINCSATKEKLEEPPKCSTVENLPIKSPENQINLLHPAHSKDKDGMNAKKEMSESTVSQSQPVPSEVQVETSETKDQEPIVEARDTTEAIQTKDAAASEMKDHAELPEVAVEAKDVSESEQEEKARESEPKPKVETSAVDEEGKKTDPDSLPSKPNKIPPLTSTLESKLDVPSTDPCMKPEDNQQERPETSVKAATAPESSGNQSASAEAKMNVGVEAKTHETAKIQETPASVFSSNIPTSISASAKTQQKRRTLPKNKSVLLRHHQTNIDSYFTLQKINCIQPSQNVFSKSLSLSSTLVLITNLPKQHDCPYTEEEVVNFLCQFGFKYAHDNIYIFARKCMALVLMPNRWAVNDIIKASRSSRLALGKSKLNASVVTSNILMSPLGFYKSVLKMTPFSLTDDESVVYIQEISPSETEDLITVLKQIGSVINYLPLVNKIFIEFETMYDTDRLGVWYSLLKRRRGHKVWRLKTPRFTSAPIPPRFPMKALPKNEEIIDGAAIVPSSDTVPPGSAPPFWVTMTTSPYVFPTVSPWFNIPAFLTVQDLNDIIKASNEASAFSTVMLTGFPEGNYTQQDVAKLVEPYFPKDDPHALNHNLVILPLQRRAFVCFCSWDVCCRFIQDHMESPVSIRGCKLQLHLVLEDLQLGSSEDLVYKTLMKWSHIYVSDLDGLEDRLLCVEISEAKLGLIKGVVTEMASAAALVNFLPLANKIWVEMLETSGVAEVMEKLFSMKESSKDQLWSKVGRIDTLKSLKERSNIASKVPMDLTVDDGHPAGTTDVLPAASESTDAGSAEPASPGDEATAPTSTDAAAAPQKEQGRNEQPQTPGNTPVPGQIQQNTAPEPQAPVERLKTEGGALKEEQRAAGGPAEAALEAKQAPTHEKDAAARKMQTDAASEGICSKPPASATTAEISRPPLPNVFTATDDPSLTAGEKMGTLLRLQHISCLSEESIKKSKYFCIQKRLVLITNLPEFHNDGYAEADISRLLQNFGFQYDDTHLYVIPQSRMAFALMPSCRSVQKLIRAVETKPLTLRGCQLRLHVVTSNMMMSPFGFYKSLMALINVQVIDDGASTIYINNISPSETWLLRGALLKMNSVKNYLPLLNKVFVEFESIRDADRLGVWHSLLKNCPSYSIFRLKVPRNDKTSLPPRLAARALPDRKDVVPGAVVPTTNVGVPLGSTAPFSVTMTTAPYVFPTMSPWFKIPDFVTVFGVKDTTKAKYRASKFSTIMLTNLPEGNYSHKEVVKLVWHYFSVQNLQTLFYKVLVLPLQRRAFVCFEDWNSCCRFVQNHGSAPVSVRSNKLNLHLVLEEIQTGSSEETLFGSLMKWSNSRVPELSSLEERLLCVHISEVSVHLIILVLKTVGAIAPFISFLPLANRICIEMAEAPGVTQVVKTISDKSQVADWSKVQRVESLKSLKQRLKEQNEVKITLDMDDSSMKTRPSTGKTGDQTGPSSVTTSKSPTVPSAKPAASTKGGPSVRETKETSAASKAVKQEEQAPTSSKVSSVAGSTSDNSSQTLIKPKDGVAECPLVVQDLKTPTTTQTSKTCEEHLCSAGPQTNEATAQSLEDLKRLDSKCPTAEHQSATTLKQKVQELAVQTGVANVNPDLEPQPKCSKGNAEGKNVENSESGKLGETGQTEPMEVQGPTTMSEDVLPVASSSSQSTKGTSPSERLTAPPQRLPNQRTAAAAPSPSPHLVPLTLGERLVKYLKPQQLIRPKRKKTKFFNQNSNVVCLANLPKYEDHCYTEDEIVDMLHKFHVECETDNVFVFFEARVALVYLASIEKLQYFFCILAKGDLVLRGHRLEPQAIRNFIQEPLLGIYKHTMKTIHFESKLLGCRMVYIQNIPPSDSGNLIRTVKNICCVKNVLPLLNKIFIECSSPLDVDLLGVWFASLKKHQPYSVNRMGWVFSSHRSDPIKAVLSSTGDVTVIQTVEVIPVGTVPPFWITMIIEPYLFYAMSPWFKIPGFWTLNPKIDSEKYSKASQFSTIMLTGHLCWNQNEILKLVWSYFTEQNLFTLSYRVVVLPLQGRAFVFFSNWNECTRFVNNQIEISHSKTHNVSVHLVLEDMNPGYCEEDLYRNLMKWSNAHVTETASLEDRLLCVEVTATNPDLAKTVLMLVARIAPFINALPLGNRIYIEMVDSDGAEEVLKKVNIPEFFQKTNKERILLIESLKSRKQRLKGCEGIPVNIDDLSQLTAKLHPQPPAVAEGQQSSSAAVTVASAGASELPSSSTSLDKNSKVTTEEDSGVQTVTNVDDVPHIDEKSFSAIKAAIQFYKQAQTNKDNQTSFNQTPLDSSKDSLSDVSAADEVHDTPSAESSSSSTQTSTETKEAQTVHVSVVANEVSTKSLEVSTSATSCSSARSSQPQSDPSGTVQTSSPASADQKSLPPSTSTNHSNLSPKSVTESEEPSEAKDLLKLDNGAEDKSSAEGRAPELEKMNQTPNLETGLKKETPEERKKTIEEQKDDDHKYTQTLSSISPQNNLSSTEAEDQRPQKDFPTSKTQMEPERSTRRRSSRRIQDTAIVTEPTTSTISTRSSTRRMSEKILNDRKVKTPPKKTPTTRKRSSSGVPDSEDLDVKEEKKPTPARPRGRPRKRRSPAAAAGEAEEPEQKRSRPPSPASNLELPPYDPKTPQGQQFVESKWGFFCKLCSVPYLPEAQHCSSKEHYDNLQKYYQTKQTS